MNTKRKIFNQSDRSIFTDLHDGSKLFTMEFDEWERQKKIIAENGGTDTPISHGITVNVYPIRMVDREMGTFEKISDSTIKFPLYRVQWLR